MNKSVGKRAKVNFKPFIKASAAAAVVIVALSLFFSVPGARAIDLSQIYSAMAKTLNIHVMSFSPERAEPVQEQWVSKALNVSIFKTPTELIVWDMANNNKRVKNIYSGVVETTSVSSDNLAGIKKNLEGSLGLLPFNALTELPRDARWQQVKTSDIRPGMTDTKAYDLIWTEKTSNGSAVFMKWRVFADTKTNLPQKVEWYKKNNDNEDYKLASYGLAQYLSESDVQAIIKNAGN